MRPKERGVERTAMGREDRQQRAGSLLSQLGMTFT